MAIKIIDEPDVRVTASELARYREEWRKFMSYYAGPPITLEEFIRRQRNRHAERPNPWDAERRCE